MRCLHSGSLSESGCLRKMGGKFQYTSPRKAAPSQMETYRDSPRFRSTPALNLETLRFHKRAAHVGSRRNSPPSSGTKRDLLQAQCPYKTRSSPPSEYKPRCWHWLVLVPHPLFWLASQVFTATFWAMWCYSRSTFPEEPSVMLEIWLLFKRSQFSWGCLFLAQTDGPRLQCFTDLSGGKNGQ